jgi:integrase
VSRRLPSYRLHRPTSQAVVTITVDGRPKDFYLGPYGTPASKTEYARVIDRYAKGLAPREATARPSPSTLTVAELLARYLDHARAYHVGPDGKNTSQLAFVKAGIRRFREAEGGRFMYLPASAFGPVALASVRDHAVAQGLSRRGVNRTAGFVRSVFAWGVSQEIVPPSVVVALKTLPHLAAGRTKARETSKVKPADPSAVERLLPHLPPVLREVTVLLTLCGARSGELLPMRGDQIDRSGDVWTYSPVLHKGRWRGRDRVIHFGPACQRILTPLLLRAGGGPLFSPSRSETDRNAGRSEERLTPLWPSHATRNRQKRNADPKRPPGEAYRQDSFRRALVRAGMAAGLDEPIRPHQLRHLAATRIRQQAGLEAARAILGHSRESMTEVYSRMTDSALAAKTAAAVG